MDIDGIIENAYNLIKDYVAKDPTAFYSYDEFELGVETIRQFCALRSESISAQLENNETTTDMNYVDASDLTLSDMGSMGGGMGGFGGDMPSMPDSEGDFNGSMPDADGTFDRSENKSDSNEGSDSTIPGGFPSEMSDDFDSSDMHGGFSGNFPAQPSGGGNANAPSGDAESNGENGENRPDGGNMQMPGGDFPFDMNGTNAPASNMTAWIWLAMSIVVLAIGLLIAKLYKH